MDKNAIKKYAVWARRELISRVSQRAALYDITEKNPGDPEKDSVHGQVLTASEKKERQALIAQIRQKGYEEVMEEVAYTWFNRFSALRFMEVNGYLPSHVRVFTDDDNTFKPQILAEAINLDLDGLDMEKVYALKNENKTDELFKYLVIVQCNALSSILPGMFQKIEDYTELLFPDNLLREGSAIERMVALIPEEDWKDQVQIIGWLYQYYNSEKKDDVFYALKKNIKITKENIPAATQLFTPDWIVRYMVENSLGRLWVEGHPNGELKSRWKYYLEEAEQEPEVQTKLAEIRNEYAALKPEDLKCIDPCCGSGHILTYLFDVLIEIYEVQGYTTRDAIRNIVENNIYGVDIDERAAQLAYFSVMMKGRQYDSRFFKRGVQPHVYAIEESNNVDQHGLNYFCNGDEKLTKAMNTIMNELHDAKEYGSILNVTPQDWNALYERFDVIIDDISMYRENALALIPMVQVAEALSQKYHVVVTNPPYMGNGGFDLKLANYAKQYYSDSKNDLYSIMIDRCALMNKKNGLVSMITMQSWINAPTFRKFRFKLFSSFDFISINNLGSRAFDEISGEKVKNVIFIFANFSCIKRKPIFVDLTNVSGENNKRMLYLQGSNIYNFASQTDFIKHEQCLIIYKTKHIDDIYSPQKSISSDCEVRRCIATGNDDLFIRIWTEVNSDKICEPHIFKNKTWYFIANGGVHRKWYGNINSVLNWENGGKALRHFNDETGKATLRNVQYMFEQGITYTYTSMGSGVFNARILESGMASIGVGPVIVDCKNEKYTLGYINSSVFRWFWDMMYGKVSTFETGNVGRISLKYSYTTEVYSLVEKCINISKKDWDSFETSWDFKRHPLIPKRTVDS